jgi:hypothetical protein
MKDTIMKSIKTLSQLLILTISFVFHTKSKAQTESANVVIDSINVVFKGNLSFPYWLKAGQTLNVGPNTASISVLEFKIDTANSNNLKFSQALTIKSNVKVPALSTWKIEAVAFMDNAIVGTKPTGVISPISYTNPGTYSWVVPNGVSRICVEVWGGGGNGAGGDWNVGGGGGGGGGGYGYSCFTVQPGTVYSVVVGSTSSNSSFGNTLLFATGGGNGSGVNGGKGGTSNGLILKLDGSSGTSGVSSIGLLAGGDGGISQNGGSAGLGGGKSYCTVGGSSVACPSSAGGNPGGGGGGGGTVTPNKANYPGSSGGLGKVVIHW